MITETILKIVREIRRSLLRSEISDFILYDLSTLHDKFDPLKFGDVGQRVA
jgi:hypothetical protein